ncbi:MAG: MlaD family protein [Bacteroidota bacterium]
MSKEIKIGLIAIISGALLYYGFNFLRGSDLFSTTNRYYAIYPNVAGLTVSNPVLFNGLNIGRVSELKLQQEKNRIVVAVDIDASFFVGALDTASLANNDFFGTKAIIIRPGSARSPLSTGDTLKAKNDNDLLSQFEPVADNLNTTIIKINALLDQLNSTDIQGAIDTLKYSLAVLTEKASELDIEGIVGNTNGLILEFKERSEQLEGLLASSKSLIDSLNQVPLAATLEKVNTSFDELNNLLITLYSEKGTIGKLLSNDSVYNNLNKLLADLDTLAIHLNNYPRDFMKPLGRKNKKLKGVSHEDK